MLPRQRRLTRRQEISEVVRSRKAGSSSLVVHARPTENGHRPRFALAVGRNVGGSVTRNRVARRLRHLLAAELDEWDGVGMDVVVRALPPAGQADSSKLGADLRYCRSKLAVATK